VTNKRNAPWLGHFARRLILDVLVHICIATCAGIVLFLVVDFVEVGNRAKETSAASDFAQLSMFSIPMIIKLITPVSAPIGALTAIGAQMRRLEIAAFFASGAPPSAIFRPLLITGLMVASVYAGIVEFLIPPSAAKTNVIRQRMGLPYANSLWGRSGWYKGTQRLYRVRTLARSDASELKDVVMLRIENGKIIQRSDVGLMTYADGQWTGRNVVHRRWPLKADDVSLEKASMATTRLAHAPLGIPEQPKDFNTGLAIPKRLDYATLSESTQIRERLGRPALAHRLELYHRHTGPLSLMFAILIAAAFGLRNGRKQSLASAMGVGASLGFSLWLIHEIASLVGATGALPAWSAAHILPLCLALGALGSWGLVESRGIRES
jgi:lipopolysaccharide export LptBFGC system permease protein LptF